LGEDFVFRLVRQIYRAFRKTEILNFRFRK